MRRNSAKASLNVAVIFMSFREIGLGMIAVSRSGVMGKRARLGPEKKFLVS